MACSTRRALSKAASFMMRAGVRPLCARATAWMPLRSPWRWRSACTAGMAAPPGSIMPRASLRQAMVLAVPITPQVPAVGASCCSMPSMVARSSSPRR